MPLTLLLSLALLAPAHADNYLPDFAPTPQALQKLKTKRLNQLSFSTPLEPVDEIRKFVDYPQHIIQTVPAMALLTEYEIPDSPWSGHTWSLRHGQIAQRYADGGFPKNDDWKTNYDYTHILASPEELLRQEKIDALSPAEKYDLLISPDHEYKFTELNWDSGGRYYRKTGVVDHWMGICHGTTAAGVLERRPTGTVDALAADGKTKISFYPADIKALASQFWAYTKRDTRYVGKRCNLKREDFGSRKKHPECFDTNAGSFHLALVNNVGLFKRPMIIDTSSDFEVWNHTLYAYKFTWVNPLTKTEVRRFSDALVQRKDWAEDPFQPYRHPHTKYIIGVRTFETHRLVTPPTTNRMAPADEPSDTEELKYDLELDENLKVIGGQWYQEKFPDFIWRPLNPKSVRGTAESHLTPAWNPLAGPIPNDWQSAARVALREEVPLYRIVQSLIEESRKNGGPATP